MNFISQTNRKNGGVGKRVFRFCGQIGEKLRKHRKALAVCALLVLAVIAVLPHPAAARWIPGGPSGMMWVPDAEDLVNPESGFIGTVAAIPEKIASAVTDVLYTFIGKVVYLIGYIVAYMGGIGVALAAWFISIMLNLNDQLLQTDAVQVGFSVSLSVANLGFVLGIIVIAIMTILRQESYGMKQILWKLVAAAILVNFSLVIIAPIFNFTNQLTAYFLDCAQGNCAGSTLAGSTRLASFNNFAKSLAGAFNPQKEFLVGLNTTGGVGALPTADTKLQGAFATVGQSIGKLLVPIMSVFFIAFMLIVIDITLVTFVLMLFVRYLIIGILLIIMPFAWLMWIFPSLSHLWTKWWNTFWRWTLFAPIVIFFLFLAMMTSNTMSRATDGVFAVDTYISGAGGPFGMLANILGATFTPLLGSFMQQLIIVGLAVGGLFAANSMSIHGASAAMGAIKGVKNATVGYVGKQSKKGARAAYRGIGGAKITEHLQKGEVLKAGKAALVGVGGVPVRGAKAVAQGVKGAATAVKEKPSRIFTAPLAAIGGGIAAGTRRLASIGGRGLAETQHNKDMVDEAKKHTPDDKHELMKNLQGSMNMETRMAHIQKAVEKGWMSHDTKIGPAGEKFGDWKDAHEEDFKNYGQEKLAEDSDTAIGSNKKMREAVEEKEKEIAANPDVAKMDAEIQDMKKDIETERAVGNKDYAVAKEKKLEELERQRDNTAELVGAKHNPRIDAAADEFASERTKDDMRKANVNAIFGPEASKTMAETIARSFARTAPQLVSSIIGKMKSPALKEFGESYPKQIKKLIEEARRRTDIADEERRKIIEGLEKAEENFTRSLNFNMYGVSSFEPPPAPPAGP